MLFISSNEKWIRRSKVYLANFQNVIAIFICEFFAIYKKSKLLASFLQRKKDSQITVFFSCFVFYFKSFLTKTPKYENKWLVLNSKLITRLYMHFLFKLYMVNMSEFFTQSLLHSFNLWTIYGQNFSINFQTSNRFFKLKVWQEGLLCRNTCRRGI